MTPTQRQALRQLIGDSVVTVQRDYQHLTPEEVIPEVIAALLSLAAYVAKHNADMSETDFMVACALAVGEIE